MNEQGEITFGELVADVRCELADRFDGSVTWYVTPVKLDLEARGVIERIPKKSSTADLPGRRMKRSST